MPDPNKLKRLKEADYSIVPTCGTCKYSKFYNRSLDWGVCSLIIYQHQKHTKIREVSIHISGTCPKFELRNEVSLDLQQSGFEIFIKP